MGFLIRLMHVIVKEGTQIPKAQVERYVSPILSIFLEDILKSKFGNEYVMIAPEFPIRIGTLKDNESNQSVNIDFLLYNKTQNKFTFVELKTDSKSFKSSQLEIYNKLEEICHDETRGVFGKLLHEDLVGILEKTKLKNKYEHLIKRWNKDGMEIGRASCRERVCQSV